MKEDKDNEEGRGEEGRKINFKETRILYMYVQLDRKVFNNSEISLITKKMNL